MIRCYKRKAKKFIDQDIKNAVKKDSQLGSSMSKKAIFDTIVRLKSLKLSKNSPIFLFGGAILGQGKKYKIITS